MNQAALMFGLVFGPAVLLVSALASSPIVGLPYALYVYYNETLPEYMESQVRRLFP